MMTTGKRNFMGDSPKGTTAAFLDKEQRSPVFPGGSVRCERHVLGNVTPC
jgi:hypothetical protein